MKNLILSLSVFSVFLKINAQTNYPCFSTSAPPNLLIAGSCGLPSNYIPYMPSATISPITYKINFHFFKRSVGAGPYDNVTATDCQNVIGGLNYRMNGFIQAPTLTFPSVPFNPTQTNINFQFTNMYFHTDDAAFNDFVTAFGNTCPTYFYSNYAVNTDSEINVFCTESVPGGSGGCGPFGQYVLLDAPGGWSTSANWPWGPSQLLAHELGHMVGNLIHADIYDFTNCPNGSFSAQFPDLNIYNLNNVCGWVPPSPGNQSNNMMSYNTCQCYLSPLQMANYYYLVNTGSYTKFTTFCDYSASQSVIVNSSQTWITSRAIGGDLIVKAGNTLIIKCDVSIPNGGKVLVEKGAKLVVDGGSLTNFCGQLWKGVEVAGTYNKSQAFSGGYGVHQGIIQLLNGATISNAINGITTGTTDAIGNFDWSSTGGVILADKTNFINNQRDIQFMYYTNNNNRSYFNQCKFQVNGLLNTSANLLDRVSLYEVQNIKFLGCDFNYNASSSYPLGSIGCGIKSIDATFIVDEACTSGTNPCLTFKQSNFTNLDYGINVINSNPLRSVRINKSNFISNNFDATKLSTVNTPVFTYNNVVVGPQYTSSGLNLINCKYYNIQNNSFTSTTSNVGIGIYATNSFAGSHQIYRNTFNGLNVGIGPQDNNSGSSNIVDGLKMNCNDFTGTPNLYDIAMMGSSPTIATDQGYISSPSTLVRNRYSAVCASNQNQFYVDNSSTKPINHSANSNSNTRPVPQPNCSSNLLSVLNSGIPLTPSIDCPDNLAPVINPNILSSKIAATQSVISSLQHQYDSLIDGGNTAELISIINSNISSGNLKNLLAGYSPFLSDDALISSFSKLNIPLGHLKEIHALNAPVSDAVWQVVLNLNLPSGIITEMTTNQTSKLFSNRHIAEAPLLAVKFDLQDLVAQKISYFIFDTISPSPNDTIVAILKSNPGLMPDAKSQLVFAYANAGDYYSANQLIGDLTESGSSKESELAILQKQWLLLQTNPFKAELLKLNSTIKSMFQDYSFDSKKNGYYNAQAYMGYVFNNEFPILRLLPLTSGSRFSSFSNTLTDPSSVGTSDFVTVHPNPNNGKLFVNNKSSFDQPLLIEIKDILGKIVYSSVVKINSQLEISTETFSNSVYFLTAWHDNKQIYQTKIVTIK